MEYHYRYAYEKYEGHYVVVKYVWYSDYVPLLGMEKRIVCHCDTIEECEAEIAELEIA